ncbi:MAG: hypothetical protein ACJAVO_001112 [Parvibaculaceae bacterium]|jgi:hypothetical protein
MEMFVLKTIMTFGLVLHLGGPVDAVMVLLGFQEPPAQVVRCADRPALCQMEVASLSIASSEWSVSGEQGAAAQKLGLRSSTVDAVPHRTGVTLSTRNGSAIARPIRMPIGLDVEVDTRSHAARVSNEDM